MVWIVHSLPANGFGYISDYGWKLLKLHFLIFQGFLKKFKKHYVMFLLLLSWLYVGRSFFLESDGNLQPSTHQITFLRCRIFHFWILYCGVRVFLSFLCVWRDCRCDDLPPPFPQNSHSKVQKHDLKVKNSTLRM